MSFVGKAINKITGADKAAQAQVDAANRSADLAEKQYGITREDLLPFISTGKSFLSSLPGLMQPLDRQAELAEYYDSPEFAMQSREARGQQLAAAEATGGLGSTSTGNALASIAPQLGMGYLGTREAMRSDLFNRLMAGAGMGLNAAVQSGQYGQNYVSQASNAFGQIGAARAGEALAPFQTVMNIGGMLMGGGGGINPAAPSQSGSRWF